MRCERGRQSAVGIRLDVAARLTSTIDRVSKGLGRLVGELTRPETFDACLSLVERILRYASCPIQFHLELVDKRHCRLVLK